MWNIILSKTWFKKCIKIFLTNPNTILCSCLSVMGYWLQETVLSSRRLCEPTFNYIKNRATLFSSTAHSTRVRQPWMAPGFEHEDNRACVRHEARRIGLMGAQLWARGLNQNKSFYCSKSVSHTVAFNYKYQYMECNTFPSAPLWHLFTAIVVLWPKLEFRKIK